MRYYYPLIKKYFIIKLQEKEQYFEKKGIEILRDIINPITPYTDNPSYQYSKEYLFL